MDGILGQKSASWIWYKHTEMTSYEHRNNQIAELVISCEPMITSPDGLLSVAES
jgi:hypothetical protein